MAKRMTGIVVSNAMNNTVVVRVEQKRRHSLYKKVVRSHRKFFAHVVAGELPTIGSQVTIVETRPLSKQIHFAVEKKELKK